MPDQTTTTHAPTRLDAVLDVDERAVAQSVDLLEALVREES